MSDVPSQATPRVVAVGGQVAAGKSSVSRGLAERLGAVRLESDAVRVDLLEGPAGDPVHEARWERIHEPGFEDDVYRELMRRAEGLLAAGQSVVLDGCFARAYQRLAAHALARARGLDFLFVQCRASPGVTRQRLAARDAAGPGSGWQLLHDSLAERWQPVTELSSGEHWIVDSGGELEGALARVEARLRAPDGPPVADRRVATFDCWNTLLVEADWKVAHALRVDELCDAAREAGRSVSRDVAERAFDAAWRRHMELWTKGVASGAHEVAQWGLAELGLDDPHPAIEHLVRSFQEASHSSDVVAMDGARETLAALDGAGVACALVCDTGLTPGRVVRRHLAREGLLGALAVQAFSDEVGAPKPDARTFAAALDPLGAAPELSFHVGDLRRTDVAGARAVGMGTVRIRQVHDDPSPLAEADHVVDSHAELLAWLRDQGVLDGEPRSG